MPSAWGLESAASVSTPGVSDDDFADFGRMRNGYGIDTDKTISPRSISFFIGGKLVLERRRLVNNQIRQIEEERLKRIEQAPCDGPHVMVRLLARVMGVGIETADMLVHEVLSRNMRDRRAVTRYRGPIGSPERRGRKTRR